ncbi:hypothetical protein POJ06DRAFT_265031 [Lipomyces tetrasporus]|uniref:Uncharacterized protein n=1 Tax=Lipomyces tetrasporus TaxID=54092 RepID=A0AAD7QZF7_9ASCO|nr:uncharacterized protein POJ06DRAFT_265031 [Lipomyces tetrasporus]KAJ8104205.1 hypothetical protein POJ06DRAFT_265031 [Lipomyces tetrasporus]
MVMTAAHVDRMSEAELDTLPVLPLAIARCVPQTKVHVVEALLRRKKFVAMTGDGVSDSPALKRSDVGIGMGLNGCDNQYSSSCELVFRGRSTTFVSLTWFALFLAWGK